MSEYKQFCRRVNLPVAPISVDFTTEVRNVQGGISTEEAIYDSRILANEVQGLLFDRMLMFFCEHGITSLKKDESARFNLKSHDLELGTFDKVINCTYANYNKFNKDLGLKENQLAQYEYTLVPIIKWLGVPVGITIMDGPFMTGFTLWFVR